MLATLDWLGLNELAFRCRNRAEPAPLDRAHRLVVY